MYLTCFKDSLPILSDSYQVIFASKLSYGCWHKPLPYGSVGRRFNPGEDAPPVAGADGDEIRAGGAVIVFFQTIGFADRKLIHNGLFFFGGRAGPAPKSPPEEFYASPFQSNAPKKVTVLGPLLYRTCAASASALTTKP